MSWQSCMKFSLTQSRRIRNGALCILSQTRKWSAMDDQLILAHWSTSCPLETLALMKTSASLDRSKDSLRSNSGFPRSEITFDSTMLQPKKSAGMDLPSALFLDKFQKHFPIHQNDA